MGGGGDDKLYAGAGHDMLEGGEGNDVLHGGDGADAFIVSQSSGNDVVIGGFDAGPGAFDHIAFTDIQNEQVRVLDTDQGGKHGTLVTWGTGSIFLEGVHKEQMAQDDFMFNLGETEEDRFVLDPTITFEGSKLIFTGPPSHDDGFHGA